MVVRGRLDLPKVGKLYWVRCDAFGYNKVEAERIYEALDHVLKTDDARGRHRIELLTVDVPVEVGT